jgi:hypothetical protein
MLSKELVHDANITSVYVAENGPVNQNNAYFEKTGIIVFENKSESDILELCSEAFGCDVILTLKHDDSQHKQNEHEWKRYNKDTVFVVPSDSSSKTVIQCIPHTLKQEWGKIDDFSLFDNNDIVQFNFEPVPGSIVLFSSTTPWILKEGRVKIYTATRKKKTPHTPMKKTTTTTTTIPTTPTTSTSSVLGPFEKLRAKHEEIKARIAKLDPRVWSNKGANATTVQKYESTIHDDSDKKALKNYAKSLATLEDRVAAAEKDTTTLPALLKSLEEIQTILSDTAKMAPLKSATRTRLLNAYEKLSKTQENLVGKTKDIADLLTELQGIEASTTPKTKKNTNSNSNTSSSSKKTVSLQIVVPQIDVDALTPYVIASADGPSGYQAVIRSYMADGSKFQTLVQASNLPELTSLYEKWVEKRKELSTLHQQNVRSDEPPQPLDVTLYVAYGEALRKIFEDTQNQNNPQKTTTLTTTNGAGAGVVGGVTNSKAVLKNITCSKCESRRKPFNGTTMCRDCWKDDHLEPLIESIEQRADYLSRQVTKEKKQISEGGAMEIDGDNEDGDDDAALDPRGPKEKLYDEYCDINEEIIEATKKFESPNASESTWEKLKALLTKADALLPTIPGTIVNEEDDENYEDDEDDMDDFLQRSSESSEASESSEESASSSSASSKKNKSKKRDRNEEDDSLAHRTLLMIHRLPVQSIREDLLKEYSKGHYVLVNERLKSLEDIKEIWGVKITEVREKDGIKKKGIPVILHTYFLEENEAAKHAADFAVDGRSEAETFSKKIEGTKKSKKNEEEEEEED